MRYKDMSYVPDVKNLTISVARELYFKSPEYRNHLYSASASDMNLIQQMLVRNSTFTPDGLEVLSSSAYACYDEFNLVDLTTEYGVYCTCMNMAVAKLLEAVFDTEIMHIFGLCEDLKEIKSRKCGGLVSKADKWFVIELLRQFNTMFPKFLPDAYNHFYEKFDACKSDENYREFCLLANQYNSNITLAEMGLGPKEEIVQGK